MGAGDASILVLQLPDMKPYFSIIGIQSMKLEKCIMDRKEGTANKEDENLKHVQIKFCADSLKNILLLSNFMMFFSMNCFL